MSENNYGITRNGFNPKPIDVIEDNLQEYLKQFFGDNVDLSSQSALYKILRVQSIEVSQLWIRLEDSFYNIFVQTARGSALDLLGEDLGLERKQAYKSEVELTIYKNTTSQVTVPINSLFQTLEGIIFSTNEEITIPSGDPASFTGTVQSTAVVAGSSGNVGSNTITEPTNTISGISSSDNLLASSGGSDIETDDEYRSRLLDYTKSIWTPSSIKSAVVNIDGVKSAKIIESATSYQILVVPKTTFTSELENEIIEAVTVVNTITVGFTVVEAQTIRINIEADVVLNNIDESTAETEASIEIEEYLSSLGIDDDVYKSKIIQAIMEVIGIENAYNVQLNGNVNDEEHTFQIGTDIYNLNYSNANDVSSTIDGILSGSPHTFNEGVDYQFLTSPARIDWSLGGDDPDDDTEFYVDYDVPANGIGDIEVNQDSIAVIESIDLNEV